MKFVLCLLLCLLPAIALAGVPDELQAVSCTIKAGDSQGSGTIVTRKIDGNDITFVWTAAHVIRGLRTTRTVLKNGYAKVLVEYKDAEIVQEIQQDGRRIGEIKYNTTVIKVSDADYGEDLALLMVRRKNAFSISTKFHESYVPAIGTKLLHVGSLLGQFGANSFTEGLVSQTGRTLPMKGANIKVFDQVTVTAFPGSSGGGVFNESGEYVGMLTQGIQQLQGFNFIVPVRRIHAWAKDCNILWAIDPDATMPSMRDIEKMPIEDNGEALGVGEPTLAPASFDFDNANDLVKQYINIYFYSYWLM